MGQEYDNELSGVLFKNDRKVRENQPDYKGNCQIDGTEYWVSGWIRTPRGGGAKYMSLAFTAKEQQSTAPVGDQGFDDEIPF